MVRPADALIASEHCCPLASPACRRSRRCCRPGSSPARAAGLSGTTESTTAGHVRPAVRGDGPDHDDEREHRVHRDAGDHDEQALRQSGFDSNQRCSGIGFGPNGFIAFGIPIRPPRRRSVGRRVRSDLRDSSSLPPSRKAVASVLARTPCARSRRAAARASTYSVSPRRLRHSAGPKPIEKRGAYTPISLRGHEMAELVHEDHEPEDESRSEPG